MSDEKGTAGSYEGETSNEDAMSLEEKIGRAKNFDKEMKDYAKATVKEFLGIYGYEEEEEEDVNMDESESSRSHETQKNSDTDVDKHKETSNSPSAPTMVTSESEYEACKDKEHPVSSVRISSSTTNGPANMTRFCITMSIPRPGATSKDGFITLRFWNCIMCSTAFIGNKPEIIQRIHHPHLFTHQPEWLSHAGICCSCQKTLLNQSPKITIYAINETPQYGYMSSDRGIYVPSPGILSPVNYSYLVNGEQNIHKDVHPNSSPVVTSVPHALGTFLPYVSSNSSFPLVICNAHLHDQCNCASAGFMHSTKPPLYQAVSVPMATNTLLKPECNETLNVTHVTPITCSE